MDWWGVVNWRGVAPVEFFDGQICLFEISLCRLDRETASENAPISVTTMANMFLIGPARTIQFGGLGWVRLVLTGWLRANVDSSIRSKMATKVKSISQKENLDLGWSIQPVLVFVKALGLQLDHSVSSVKYNCFNLFALIMFTLNVAGNIYAQIFVSDGYAAARIHMNQSCAVSNVAYKLNFGICRTNTLVVSITSHLILLSIVSLNWPKLLTTLEELANQFIAGSPNHWMCIRKISICCIIYIISVCQMISHYLIRNSKIVTDLFHSNPVVLSKAVDMQYENTVSCCNLV